MICIYWGPSVRVECSNWAVGAQLYECEECVVKGGVLGVFSRGTNGTRRRTRSRRFALWANRALRNACLGGIHCICRRQL